MKIKCKVGCPNPAQSHGYCRAHYYANVSPYRGLVTVIDVEEN